jgi:predicted kinase
MVMPRLVVISGPANTGKMAKAWEIAAADPELRLLHRDQVRVLFGRSISEDALTDLMAEMAESLLCNGYGVITVSQNLQERDRDLWREVADLSFTDLEWITLTHVYEDA